MRLPSIALSEASHSMRHEWLNLPKALENVTRNPKLSSEWVVGEDWLRGSSASKGGLMARKHSSAANNAAQKKTIGKRANKSALSLASKSTRKEEAVKLASPRGSSNRRDAKRRVIDAVWIRAAGHCELCSRDLTYDRLGLTLAKLGEVAHILPASPNGPRDKDGQQKDSQDDLYDCNDPGNLMLLCPSCHTDIDKTPDNYPANDLTAHHEAFLASVSFAAARAKYNEAQGLLIHSQHLPSVTRIDPSQLQSAMWRDRLRPLGRPLVLTLPHLDGGARDDAYYVTVRKRVQRFLKDDLPLTQSEGGDGPQLGVAGIADMPSLMIVGEAVGDRRRRRLYSYDRETGLMWPDANAEPKDFDFTFNPKAPGPLVLALHISALLPLPEILDSAPPDANIAHFIASEPSYGYVKNERFIGHFRDELQKKLSILEAHTPKPIHLFMAVPAALAFELGALRSTNHRHRYVVYDRDDLTKKFRPHVILD